MSIKFDFDQYLECVHLCYRDILLGNVDISSLFTDSYFSERYVGRATATGDYDNDGDVDIFVVNSNQKAILLRNEEGNRNNWIQIKLVGTTDVSFLVLTELISTQ